MLMKRTALFILFLVSTTSYASLQVQQERDTAILLKEVVVITPQRMEQSTDMITEAVSVQDRDEIIRLSPMSTPDAMSSIAGVWMQKTNHGGGSPFIRGLTGYHTLLLFDGIRFNNSTFRSGPNQYLSTIDPLTLQRVEVLRGQGSVQYGSDGIGGVAQFFFREPEFASHHRVEATGRLYANCMSHDMEYAGRAEVELGTSNFALLGGITYKTLGDIKAGGDLGTLDNTGYKEQSWDVKTKVNIGNAKLTAVWQHLAQKDVPLYHQIASGNYVRYHFNPQQRNVGYVRLESSYQSKIFSTVKYTLAYLNSLEEREKQRTSSPVLRLERDYVNTYHGAAEIISDFANRWKASSGVEFYFDNIESSAIDKNQVTNEATPARGLYPDGTTYANMAIFSMHAIDLNRFTISLGARYNFLQLNVNDPVFGKTVVQPQATVGNVGVSYKVNKSIQLLASGNTGFRAPNVNDVASFGVADYRYEVPNYNLDPEKSVEVQLGLRTHTRKFSGEFFVFQNHLNDLISNVTSSYNGEDSIDGFKVYRKENVNKALIKGMEMELHYHPNTWLSAFTNLTYTVGDNVTRQEPLSRIPPLFGRVGMDIKLKKKFTYRLEFLAASTQDRLSGSDKQDSRIAKGGTPGWAVVNTRFQYVYRNFYLQTGIQNIFNTAYRIHGSGVDGVGRSFWISLVAELSSAHK